MKSSNVLLVIILSTVGVKNCASFLFSLCTDNSTCADAVENSFCDFEKDQQCHELEGVCSCIHPYIPSDNETTCRLKYAGINETCEVEEQCVNLKVYGAVPLSSCAENETGEKSCQCNDGTTICDNKCCPKKYFGESCVFDEECTGSHLVCPIFEHQCKCETGYLSPGYVRKPGTGDCFLLREYLGQSCADTSEQCNSLPNSFCNEETKTCECNPDTHAAGMWKTRCLPLVMHLKEECSESAQCHVANSECVKLRNATNSHCECIDGWDEEWVQSERIPDTCVEARSMIGDPCVEDIQCRSNASYSIGLNTECAINGTCQCKAGYVFGNRFGQVHGLCFPLAAIGGDCSFDAQCMDAAGSQTFTWCGSTCYCDGERSTLKNGICFENKVVGDSCQVSEECRAAIKGGVICSSGTCQCDAGYKVVDGLEKECKIK